MSASEHFIPPEAQEFADYLRDYCKERGLSGPLDQLQWDDFVEAMDVKARSLGIVFDPYTGCFNMKLDS